VRPSGIWFWQSLLVSPATMTSADFSSCNPYRSRSPRVRAYSFPQYPLDLPDRYLVVSHPLDVGMLPSASLPLAKNVLGDIFFTLSPLIRPARPQYPALSAPPSHSRARAYSLEPGFAVSLPPSPAAWPLSKIFHWKISLRSVISRQPTPVKNRGLVGTKWKSRLSGTNASGQPALTRSGLPPHSLSRSSG
jgi:hypothetical protein